MGMYTHSLGANLGVQLPKTEYYMEITRDLSRKLKLNIGWPLIMTACLFVVNIIIYFVDLQAGVMLTIFVLLFAAVTAGFYFLRRHSLMRDLASCAVE